MLSNAPMVLAKEDKWKAVSHLQKCIRRGWGERIETVAKALWDTDNAYLRYRLAVIAVEDVGIANMDEVRTLLDDKINKRWVMTHGGIDGLIESMHRLARGTKDRTACSWGSNASKTVFETESGLEWEQVTPVQACEMAWNPVLSPAARAAAVFRAVGTDIFPHHAFPELSGDWASWISACTSHSGGLNMAIETMVLAQKAMKEWHPAFLPLCWHEHHLHPLPDIVSPPKDWGQVGLFCGASLDGHTAEGKRAIASWWRTSTELRSGWAALGWRGPDDEAVALLTKMVFLLEGGGVDKRLGYAMAVDAENTQKVRWAERAGMDGKAAATVVWRNMAQLTSLRQRGVSPFMAPDTQLNF